MKKYGVWVFIIVLIAATGVTAWLHLSTREEVASGTVQLTIDGQAQSLALADLKCEAVSGVRVNGKGESIPVEGQGVLLKALLTDEQLAACTQVTVTADDSYSAVLTADEVKEDGKAYLLLQDNSLRLVVFGDENSKRSITNVVQIIVE